MHSLPQATELQWCVGDEFAAVTIGPFIVNLHLSAGGRISAEYAIEQVTPAGEAVRYEVQSGDGNPRWSSLLLKKIVQVSREDELALRIDLEDGAIVRVFSELGQYESGQIESPTGGFWVS